MFCGARAGVGKGGRGGRVFHGGWARGGGAREVAMAVDAGGMWLWAREVRTSAQRHDLNLDPTPPCCPPQGATPSPIATTHPGASQEAVRGVTVLRFVLFHFVGGAAPTRCSQCG